MISNSLEKTHIAIAITPTLISLYFVNVLCLGVCKKMRDLLDAILLLGNMLTIHKNKMRSRYVMLGLVKFKPDMSYDT